MIYTRIRNIREDNDLTQDEMASYLNVAQRSYSRYENGERAMPIETLMKIADGFGTSVDYLLERTDEKQPYKYAAKYKKKLNEKIIKQK